jgi:2-amino-4-hydroxy-6-hydroxymethyldihydropteridine diphosphokinase
VTKAKLAYIALGSNLGDSLSIMCEAAQSLAHLGEVKARSSLYETEPVGGPKGQANYLNAVIALETTLSAEALLKALLNIETQFGRERRIRWDARTLDLDLLSFDSVVIASKHLILPHPQILERVFVLVPLLEIAPDWRHPVTKQRAEDALALLIQTGIKRTDLRC